MKFVADRIIMTASGAIAHSKYNNPILRLEGGVAKGRKGLVSKPD